MTLLSFADIRVEFGAETLLDKVSFTVGRGERWGVVGRNGAGKTTLFKLITGALKPTRGAVARMPGLKVTLLDQHRDFGDASSVWEAAAAGYGDVVQLEKALTQQAERLAELGERATESDIEKYGRDMERFAHIGGYDYHARVDAVLQGLGFDPEECKTRPLAKLSGGERGRVGLAAPLAAPADLLLLDEPTNHLDLDTTRWLTRYLGELGETVIVISHDRAFLDETVDHVLHVSAGAATPYRGGYSAFVQQKAERELTLRRAVEKQQAFVSKEADYIRRHLAGQNSAQAKGRRKRLDRLPRLSPPPGEAGAMTLVLEIGDRGGDRVFQTEKLTVAVGTPPNERVLLKHATVTLMRGDVIALVAPNGAGKTTLLSTLLGAREPQGGEVRIGGSITTAWYRQDLAGVPLDKSIYDVIQDLRPLWARGQIQGLLGAFGFTGDEVLRSTNSLSGGERARVALAMITLRKANLLVLDEPTNHLDVESIEALEDGIEEYEGTTVIVSHDRAFLRELATRVWAIRDGKLIDFSGSFVEWEAAEAVREKQVASAASDARRDEKVKAAARAAEKPKARGAGDGDKRAAKRRVEAAEQDVAASEGAVKRLEEAVADESLYDGSAEGARKAATLTQQLDDARRTYDEAVTAWATASEVLEQLR